MEQASKEIVELVLSDLLGADRLHRYCGCLTERIERVGAKLIVTATIRSDVSFVVSLSEPEPSVEQSSRSADNHRRRPESTLGGVSGIEQSAGSRTGTPDESRHGQVGQDIGHRRVDGRPTRELNADEGSLSVSGLAVDEFGSMRFIDNHSGRGRIFGLHRTGN